MAVNDDKMNKFYLAINHYAEEQRKKIEQEVAEFKQKELDEAEVDVLTEAYRLIQKEMAEMRNGISREMAQREMEGRKELLAKRQKITTEVFERARKALVDYTQTGDYAGLLKKFAAELSKTFTKPGTVLCIKKEDENYQELIKEAFGKDCVLKINPDIHIGGIRAYNSQMGIAADVTLDSMLEDQREWFAENSGMAVV
ncbi:V-type ATP synthase subunit E [Caproiciproducens sp.]|uniref:V-type ATP synthase subunit E n=1 Tax=Caproiciproducens sp. TaxID=1954376 RepID=UPI0028A193A0|nr:V-type ATP synthase subunit E family protein [Caproiciproducens sp.]